jgi:hypothetical protein
VPGSDAVSNKIGQGRMVKDGKAAEETVSTLVADGLNASKLTAMNPSELFRLAAELGLAIEPVPSPSPEDLRLNRYIE